MLDRSVGPVAILDLDSYYLDRSSVASTARPKLNFDEPAAFEVPLVVAHLRELRDGRPVEKPHYSFADHVRLGSSRLAPAPVVIVEGLFALWWSELRELLDCKVYVEASEATRLARRVARDVASRGRTADSVYRQFDETVKPMHVRYIEPTRRFADIVVTNEGDLSHAARCLVDALSVHDGRARSLRIR
jgi:uridine kinase